MLLKTNFDNLVHRIERNRILLISGIIRYFRNGSTFKLEFNVRKYIIHIFIVFKFLFLRDVFFTGKTRSTYTQTEMSKDQRNKIKIEKTTNGYDKIADYVFNFTMQPTT